MRSEEVQTQGGFGAGPGHMDWVEVRPTSDFVAVDTVLVVTAVVGDLGESVAVATEVVEPVEKFAVAVVDRLHAAGAAEDGGSMDADSAVIAPPAVSLGPREGVVRCPLRLDQPCLQT